jgi:hypothetical protein
MKFIKYMVGFYAEMAFVIAFLFWPWAVFSNMRALYVDGPWVLFWLFTKWAIDDYSKSSDEVTK